MRKFVADERGGLSLRGINSVALAILALSSCLDGERDLQFAVSDFPPVVINEVLAVNDANIRNSFGEFSDWIELANTTDEPVDLSEFSLSDDPQDPEKFSFQSESVGLDDKNVR